MSRQHIDFKVTGADKDSGDEDVTAIKPVADGEPGFAAVFTRPAENLRTRTERIRTDLDNLRYLTDADRELLLTSAGNVTWLGLPTGKFTVDADLTLKPFLAPALSTPSKLLVHTNVGLTNIITIATRTDNALGQPRAYNGANKFSFDFTPGGAILITQSPTDSNEFHVQYNPATTTNTALVAALTANVPFTTTKGLVATFVGVGADLVDVQTAVGAPPVNEQLTRFLAGAADAEKHIIPIGHFVAFFVDPLNVLTEGDVLAISYDDLVLASVGGRRQSINEGPEFKSSIPVGSLFLLRRFPERLPLALPLATVLNGKLIFINRRVYFSGETGPLVASDASYQGSPAAPNSWADNTVVAGIISFEQALDTIIQTLGTKTVLPSGSTKIGYKPSGNISGDNVQDAITELDVEKAGLDLINTFTKKNFFTPSTANTVAIEAQGSGFETGIIGYGGPTAGAGVYGQGSVGGAGGTGVVGSGGTGSNGVQGNGNTTGSGVKGVGGINATVGDFGIGVLGQGGAGAVGGDGVRGTGTGAGKAGVSGLGGTGGPGVSGTGGTNAPGILGVGNGSAAGVSGVGNGGIGTTGVLGTTAGAFTSGVKGTASTLFAYGVKGEGTGGGVAIFGEVVSGAAGAVIASADTGNAINAANTSNTLAAGNFVNNALGTAVRGETVAGSIGILGWAKRAPLAPDPVPTLNLEPGVYGRGNVGVIGEGNTFTGSGIGVYGIGHAGGSGGLFEAVDGGSGVVGLAAAGSPASGVDGTSTTGPGVRGVTQGAVPGPVIAAGVRGMATSGEGVRGDASSGIGVHGTSGSSHGVYGSSTSGNGVLGQASGGSPGVTGWNDAGTGITYGVAGRDDSPSGYAGHFLNSVVGVGLKVMTAGQPAAGTAQFVGDLGSDLGSKLTVKAWNPATTAGFANTLTPKNVCKAWGTIVWNALGDPTLQEGFNIASVTTDSNPPGPAFLSMTTVTFAGSPTENIGRRVLFGTSTASDTISADLGGGLREFTLASNPVFDATDVGRIWSLPQAYNPLSPVPATSHNEGRFVIESVMSSSKIQYRCPNGQPAAQTHNGFRYLLLNTPYSVCITVGGQDETFAGEPIYYDPGSIVPPVPPVHPAVVALDPFFGVINETYPDHFTFYLKKFNGALADFTVNAPGNNIESGRSRMRNFVVHFQVFGPQFL